MNANPIAYLFCLLLLSGCQPTRQHLTLVPVALPQDTEPTLDAGESAPPSNAELVYDNSPELNAALKQFETSGKAPIIKHAGFVTYPFGEVQPVLNCQESYGCDIELEPGEQVKAVILGDDTMWDYLVWESNQQDAPRQHVTIGPRVAHERTNAIIGTDRRTYHLELLSTDKAEYVRSAKFYYPRERLRQFQKSHRAEPSRASLSDKAPPSAALPYQSMSFAWDITADGVVRWKPTRVFDDRAHIYLYFPEDVRFDNFPGVYTPIADGRLTKPNWRTVEADSTQQRDKGTYIIVDGMFDELRLIGEVHGGMKTVTIRKRQQ